MSAAVPRRAAFDDLRVGQWVVIVYDNDSAYVGRVAECRSTSVDVGRLGRDGFTIFPNFADDDHGEVTILRDAPAAPVTVRREDYDRLAVALTDKYGFAASLTEAASALIDNADLGDDQ